MDPLDEIGDLVDRTLNILGNTADPYEGLGGATEGSGSQAQERRSSNNGAGSNRPSHAGTAQQGTKQQPASQPSGKALLDELDLDLLGQNISPPSGAAGAGTSSGGGALGAAPSDMFEEQSLVDPLLTDQMPPKKQSNSADALQAYNTAAGPLAPHPMEASDAGASSAAGPSSSAARSEISADNDHQSATHSRAHSTASGVPHHMAHEEDLMHGPSHISAGDAPIRVTIKEPEKVETTSSIGLKTHYVQYVVRTDSAMPGLQADGVEVRRRFSDFDALHKYLRHEYRGFIIPPLPEKSFLQGKIAQDDFIRLRRADLQAFVRGMIRHPVLRESEAIKVFLLQPGELMRNPAWTYLIHPPPGVRAHQAGSPRATVSDELTPVGSTIKAGLGTWMNWMKASVAQLAPPKRELPEDEVQLRHNKELLTDLQRLLELAVEAARGLCGHMEAFCGDVKELGRTFAMLSRFEEAVQAKVGQYTEQGVSAGNRAADLNRVAYGSVKQHTVWKSLSLKTAASLVTLHDYYVLVPEAVAALEVREAALTHLHALQDELAAKQSALEQATSQSNKLRLTVPGGPGAAEKRSYQLSTAIAALEDQIKAAQQDYEMVKQRNQTELARLSLEREADFRRMMVLFTQTQAGLVQASADMWASLAAQFAQPQPQPQ